MSREFENTLIEIYEKLDIDTFRTNTADHYFFVCGGEVDAGKPIPPSFRDRLLTYTSTKYEDMHNALILAETFKDYFQENAYPDLLIFEEEIASICTLVIIFLESAGSLVELGLFCAKPDYYKKLLVVAPDEHLKSEDSFIYLGPLENLRKKDASSVATYPWPNAKEKHYDTDHLEDLCETIQQKTKRIYKSEQFDRKNSGHICFLIEEIIRIGYPILIGEIELSLAALELEISHPEISRKIYLLKKFNIIGRYEY